MKTTAAEKDDALIANLLENKQSTTSKALSSALLSSKNRKGTTNANVVAVPPMKRLTKKEKKLMESQSQHRTIVEIISDTKSGEPLRSANKSGKTEATSRKRDTKADRKNDQVVKQAAS